MPFDPWKQKLTPLNPKPENRKVGEQLNETGEEALRDGYSVLDRAQPRNPYNRARDADCPRRCTITPTSLGTSEE
jgi:hypothetical protein